MAASPAVILAVRSLVVVSAEPPPTTLGPMKPPTKGGDTAAREEGDATPPKDWKPDQGALSTGASIMTDRCRSCACAARPPKTHGVIRIAAPSLQRSFGTRNFLLRNAILWHTNQAGRQTLSSETEGGHNLVLIGFISSSWTALGFDKQLGARRPAAPIEGPSISRSEGRDAHAPLSPFAAKYSPLIHRVSRHFIGRLHGWE